MNGSETASGLTTRKSVIFKMGGVVHTVSGFMCGSSEMNEGISYFSASINLFSDIIIKNQREHSNLTETPCPDIKCIS